jgi:hypothetical protein
MNNIRTTIDMIDNESFEGAITRRSARGASMCWAFAAPCRWRSF